MNSLTSRLLYSIILIPIALYVTYLGGITFQIMISIAGALMFLEWQGMIINLRDWRPYGLFGLAYIALPCAALIQIRELEEVGLSMIIWLLMIVWGTDIGGYLAGKRFGGRKLAPRISPNKTWAGAIGGILLATLASTAYMMAIEGPAIFVHALLAVFFSIISQGGDLFESWIKRKCQVKDSGKLLGAHGGVLDRLDGLLPVAVVAWLFLFVIRPIQ